MQNVRESIHELHELHEEEKKKEKENYKNLIILICVYMCNLWTDILISEISEISG